MRKVWVLAGLTAIAAAGSSCPPNTGGNPGGVGAADDNLLEPRAWAYLQSDEEGTGFNAVHSTYALPPLKKWSVPVGELSFGSPVIGADGTIYIGNLAGEVVAVNPNGTEKWRTRLGLPIISTPAVDIVTGEIFVVTQFGQGDNTFVSFPYRLSAAGQPLASTPDSLPISTTASPKLWRDFFFLPSGNKLYVLDQETFALFAEANIGTCFNLVCGSGPDFGGWVIGALRVFGCVVTLGLADLTDLADICPDLGFSVSLGSGAFVQPSVAIVDQASLVETPSQPIIVTATGQCVAAYRFHFGAADPALRLEYLWQHELVPVDCDFETVRSTTPAILSGGQVVVGDDNGRVRSWDLLSGVELWKQELESPVQAPPVAFLRQIYVVTADDLVVLDSDGDLMTKVPLRGTGQAAAMGLDFVYVTTTEGIHTVDLLGTEGFAFDGSVVNDRRFGQVGLALGTDGTVYVSTPDGFLHAYGQGTLARRVQIPAVTWTTPAAGASISYAAGRSLSLNVAAAGGGNFAGRVRIVSDVDGTLCEFDVNGTVAACTTTRALTLGNHTLTAYATDADGGTNTAQVTVTAANTGPSVSIQQPANNAILFTGSPIPFAAAVSDPDEPAFPGARIVWRSSRDGELGTGATLQRPLTLGNHIITVTVTDAFGLTAEASVQVNVQSNLL